MTCALVSDDYGLVRDRALVSDVIAIGPRFLFADDMAAGRLSQVSSTFEATYTCLMLTGAERARMPVINSLFRIAASCGVG